MANTFTIPARIGPFDAIPLKTVDGADEPPPQPDKATAVKDTSRPMYPLTRITLSFFIEFLNPRIL
jgi:hypothetical protein